VSRPIADVVAALDPEISAKNVQPSTLVCSKPPGRWRTQGSSEAKRLLVNRERYNSSAIKIKRGSATSSGEDRPFQTCWASSLSTGRLRKSDRLAMPTPIRLNDTQAPLASSKKSSAIVTSIGAGMGKVPDEK